MSLLFTPEYRSLLTRSADWHLICSALPADPPPVYDAAHYEWLRAHTDSHPQREALFCLEGNVVGSLDNQLYRCSHGSLLLFNEWERHDCGYAPGNTGVHLWLGFVQKRIIGRILAIDDGRFSNIGKSFFMDNPGIYNLIIQEWSGIESSLLDDSLKRQRLFAMFSLLFLELIELDMKTDAYQENPEGQQFKIICLIEEHIRNTSGRGLTIEKLARISGYSKFHFIRLFKQQTGYKIHDYINLARINRIAELEAAGARQKEVAEELGFSCPSAYSHWRQKQSMNKTTRARGRGDFGYS